MSQNSDGRKEFEKLKDSLPAKSLDELKEFPANEKFCFGPSKLYDSDVRAEMRIMLRNVEITGFFFIVKRDIPILIGNDIL